MNPTTLDEWVQETCLSVCTVTDLREIARHREFPATKNMSKEAYAEHVQLRWLQDMGLEKAFGSLNEESLWALHALKCAGKSLKLSDLAVFYGFKQSSFYYSAGALKDIYGRVQENLLRRGLVLIHVAKDWQSRRESRWLQYEILFPESFAKKLPPPPLATEQIAANPSFQDWWAAALAEIRCDLLPEEKSLPREIPIVPRVQVESGALRVGDISRISMDTFFNAIRNRWLGLSIKKEKSKDSYHEPRIGPFASDVILTPSNNRTLATDIGMARGHLLDFIPEGHGISEDNLKIAYSKFGCSLKDNEFQIFIREGIRFGFLNIVNNQGNKLLVPNRITQTELSSPTFARLKETNDTVQIHLTELNLTELLRLAQVSEFKMVGEVLYARPLPVEIGRRLQAPSQLEEYEALRNASSLYRQVFKTMEKRLGQVIVHSNLSVIRIASDELRHILRTNFDEKMADLGEDYFAVSRKDLPDLIEYAKKKGFAPKVMLKKNQKT